MADDKWAALTASARDFFGLVARGDVVAATPKLNDAMRQSLPGDTLKQLWSGLESQVGKFQGEGTEVKTAVEDGYDCVYLQAKFEKTPLWIKIVFQGEQVAGLQFVPNAP